MLVLPGLAANDLTTLPMRTFLKDRGYEALPWEQGLNLGPRAGVLDALRARVRELHALDGRKVSLLGWSLGGVYARELAKEMPELVRCVITLGSPFSGPPQATNAWWLFERVSGHPEPDAAMQAALRVRAAGAHDVDLFAHRRHRRVAVQPEPAGPAGREHRGAREPHRPGPEPARDGGHRRPARAGSGALAAVRHQRPARASSSRPGC